MIPPSLERAYGEDEIKRRLLERRRIDDVSGCWCWTGARQSSGYGVITLRRAGGKKLFTVHRLAAMIWVGLDSDSNLSVLHSCDRPECYNPDHLRLGNNHGNVQDAVQRGRHRFAAHSGEQNGRSKLSSEDVRAARLEYARGTSIRSLAARHGVTYSAMWQAIRGLTWHRRDAA